MNVNQKQQIEKSGLAYGHDIFTGNQGSILVGRGNRKVPTAREWSCKPPCTPPIRMDPDLIHRPPFQTVATFSADHMRSGLHADRSERVRYAERTDVANGGNDLQRRVRRISSDQLLLFHCQHVWTFPYLSVIRHVRIGSADGGVAVQCVSVVPRTHAGACARRQPGDRSAAAELPTEFPGRCESSLKSWRPALRTTTALVMDYKSPVIVICSRSCSAPFLCFLCLYLCVCLCIVFSSIEQMQL